MRTVLKHIVNKTYRPLLVRYLSKTRIYRYEGIRLEVPPEVFHPGFFSSTGLLLNYIRRLDLVDANFLELGAGSGIISLYAARLGAKVTASDINPVAIGFLHRNSEKNQLPVRIIQSDLFSEIKTSSFDIIAINPPYYKKQPRTAAEQAWFCGENGEYFTDLFRQLPHHVHAGSKVVMVLCDGCDIDMVRERAITNGFDWRLELAQPTLLEKNFIFSITKKRSA